MKKYLLNGLFYSQKTTGVHRFARELICELDKVVPRELMSIAIPHDAKDLPVFDNISFLYVGKHSGLLWEQWDLPRFTRRTNFILVSLCNSQPLLAPGIICIHDVAYKTHPEYFKTIHGRFSVAWHRIIYWQALKYTRYPILTVSYFSKYSIIDTYSVEPCRISVVSNGWQHLKNVSPDVSVLDRFHLKKDGFYFTLGNINYNKNTRWIVEYAQKHPSEIFVLSGEQVKNSVVNLTGVNNVYYLGYLSDSEIVALYKNCKAFIFPSIHEGFGIPPMEALYYGAKVIVANTSCLPEIYQGSVYYIDAYDTDIELNTLLNKEVNNAESVLNQYDWSKSALKVRDLLLKYLEKYE